MHWAIYFSLVQSVLVWYPIARGNTFCQECRRVVPTATGTPHNRDNNIEIPAFSILVVDCMEQTFLKSWDETPVCLQPPNFVAKDVVRKFFPVDLPCRDTSRMPGHGREDRLYPTCLCTHHSKERNPQSNWEWGSHIPGNMGDRGFQVPPHQTGKMFSSYFAPLDALIFPFVRCKVVLGRRFIYLRHAP